MVLPLLDESVGDVDGVVHPDADGEGGDQRGDHVVVEPQQHHGAQHPDQHQQDGHHRQHRQHGAELGEPEEEHEHDQRGHDGEGDRAGLALGEAIGDLQRDDLVGHRRYVLVVAEPQAVDISEQGAGSI